MIKDRYGKDIPFMIHRKVHGFGNTDRVRASILAVKCEDHRVVEIKEVLQDI